MFARKDMKDPIIEVSARYGEDGYCVFGSFSDDLRTCAISRSAKNPSYYASACLGFDWVVENTTEVCHCVAYV